MHIKIWVSPPPKPRIFDFYRRLRNLTPVSAAYIFGTKHDVDNSVSCTRRSANGTQPNCAKR